MSLYIITPRRTFEIDEIYPTIMVFLIGVAIGKILKSVLKRLHRRYRISKIANPNGGGFNLELFDDDEIVQTILICIQDNNRYLVKDPQVRNAIFALVKAKIKNQSLVITPNMLRFLALRLINNDQTLIVNIRNILVSSTNRARLVARVSGGVVVGIIGAIFSMLPYAAFAALVYFENTKNCGYKCSNYFEQFPKEGPIRIYGNHEGQSNGHLVIADNNDARQLEFYIPSNAADEVTTSSNGELRRTQSYKKIQRKKMKQVNFQDFKQTDPVLSSFKDLEEPQIPEKKCSIQDAINVQVE